MIVLVVEDEILLQKSLAKLMERQGVEVIATSSGLEAIEILKSQHCDKMICDLMLADITGFDVIEEARILNSNPKDQVQIFIMTAYSSSTILDKAKEYGCDIFSKPFENIHEVVKKILS